MPEQDFPNGNGDARTSQGPTEAAAAFGETLHDAEDFVKRQWRQNPIGVAAIFAGFGLLLGLMLRRR